MIKPLKEFIEIFKATPGALSVCESIAIINIVTQAPKEGIYIELGSHKGKSGLSAAYGMSAGKLYMVDPIYDDKGICKFVRELIISGLKGKINPILINGYSTDVIEGYNNIAYVFVDSGVHDDLVMVEVKMLEDRVIKDGIICFHDYLNQFTAVERAYNYLLSTGKYEEIKIDWQPIFDYVKENNLEEGNQSWHQYPELPHPPNFVGALKRK